jgi:hypothetical protein
VSSTILTVIVLVVMWLVVLVPMFVRRPDESQEDRSGDRPTSPARILARQQVTGYDEVERGVAEHVAEVDVDDDADAVTDVDEVDPGGGGTNPCGLDRTSHRDARGPRGSGDSPPDPTYSDDDQEDEEASREVYEDGFDEFGPQRARTRTRMIVRRRRVLATLAAFTLGTLVLALLGRGRSWVFGVQVLCDLLFVAYIVGLRREVRRERVRRAVLLARATAARARASARRSVRTAPPPRPARQRPARPAGRPVPPPAPPAPSVPQRRRRATGTTGPEPVVSDEPDDPLQQRRVV